MPSERFESTPSDTTRAEAVARLELYRTTTFELLDRLLLPSDEAAWIELHRRYRPVLLGFSKRLGLSDADADDVAQETLLRMVRSYAHSFDRERGTLRGWMIGIARRVVYDLGAARQMRRELRGDSALAELPAVDRCEEWIDEECRRVALELALRELAATTRLAPRTILAFERVVFREEAPGDVAESLEMSLDSVYASKHRCLRELRKIMARIEPLYDLDEARGR